jgi:hypothetical protein
MEMSALCEWSIDPYTMHKAARVVSGQDGSTYARNDKFTLERIHFGQLPDSIRNGLNLGCSL